MQTKEILKELRKQNNYSAQQVANGCSMSLGVYKKYESGERGVGTPALCKFADFYGVTTDYLLGRENSKSKESGKEMTVEEMEDDIINRWLKLGEIGREIVYNMLLSMVDLAEAKQKEESQRQQQPQEPKPPPRPDIQISQMANSVPAIARGGTGYKPAPTDEQFSKFVELTPDMLGEELP